MTPRKHYVDTGFGQIHVRTLDAAGAERQPPLICLHPAPFSGAYFETVMPLLNAERRVIAPDYPGYGGSTPLHEPPAIDDYARAMRETLDAFVDGPVDLLGFHSGCLVSVEFTLQARDRVRRMVLADIPYFDTDTQQKFYAQVAKPLDLNHDLESVQKAWEFCVAARKDVVPIDRALEMFVDQLKSGTRDYYCFHAAFTYDCLPSFASVDAPVVVIATESPLKDATIAAADAIEGSTLVRVEEIQSSVFEHGAQIIAPHIVEALNS